MKKLLTAAFVLSSLLTAPGIVTTASAQAACGAGAPESWSRPGGFCDQIQSGKSLSLPGDENCTELEYYFPEAAVRMQPEGVRVHMAVTCSVNCGDYYESSVDLRTMQLGDRARVAEIPTECQIEE